jgi:hypothetical protein
MHQNALAYKIAVEQSKRLGRLLEIDMDISESAN